MGTLFTILVCLFAALFVVVKLTEKHGKPLEAEQQQQYSKIIMVLVGVMLLAAAIKFFVAG
jgi:threonine/homoserine/homoserine lactone efflux protein